ncbi:MAG TPA: RnfABCDGE type electron transport complex subunit B, partial [Acidiferrobacterales bacterium]|nr:RnfABCDGE type electron transport complex subunit B [Acidiferrobacterales bacterium]
MLGITDEMSATVDRIDACLPQTQCTQCGYPRCRAYAEALARGTAEINQCPPGGDITIAMLSALLMLPPAPLDPHFGAHGPRTRAVIDEALCIGCRKCLDACPVDAIVGARKLMHTVIAAECTGCGLCLPPCPVDCIALLAVTPATGDAWPEYTRAETAHWRLRT